MHRIIAVLTLLACLVILPATQARAWFFDDDTLLTINGQKYTTEDFKRWWKLIKDEDSSFPETPDRYIEWLLLSREAKQMGLDTDPAFKRQTRIFLQSRTLLMVKYDDVDSRINISEADIEARYAQIYTPHWLVEQFEFKDEATAMAAWQELEAGTLTESELLERTPEQGGPVNAGEVWVNPKSIDAGWRAIFEKQKVGEMVNPSEHKNGRRLFYLKDQKGRDDEEFAKVHDELEHKLWKEQEDALTLALLAQLRDQYEVEVNDELIEALDVNVDPESLTDAVVIKTNRENVTEQQFAAVVHRLMKSRGEAAHAAVDKEKASKLKAETLSNIIATNLTNWASLDRHYEEKEPFKWEYDFNYNHRLVIALEDRLFDEQEKTTDDEIKQYYQENIGRYTQPTMVKLYIVDETQGPIDKIWADVAAGRKFKQAVKEYDKLDVKLLETPANHLDPEVKPIVDKLNAGETSQIFDAQDVRLIVHLVDRTPETLLPLERAKESIRRKLIKEKLAKARHEYVDALKSSLKIEVKQRQWEAIQKEFGGE